MSNIRTSNINNTKWFIGKDVAKALGYKDTADALKSTYIMKISWLGILPSQVRIEETKISLLKMKIIFALQNHKTMKFVD